MSDYTTSGFDAFLSRSIDNLPQSNLNSGGPVSTQIRYDSSQLSGGVGDAFTVGNTTISSSNGLSFYDNFKNLILQEGQLDNSNTGLRVFDNNGRSVAQFGKFSDGSVALKVAKPGFDAADASNDQLIFNSNQNVFKIVSSGTATIPSFGVSAPGVGNYGFGAGSVTITHGLGFVPAVIVFDNTNGINALWGVSLGFSPPTDAAWYTPTMSIGTQTATFGENLLCTGGAFSGGNKILKYYLLQETAT